VKCLNRRNRETMERLTEGLADPSGEGESSRTIDRGGAGIMAVHVERIGKSRYSVAHYYKSNGDLVADPDVEFVHLNGEWIPVAIQEPIGGYRVAVQCDASGNPVRWSLREQADLARFSNTLIANIREQQRIE